MHRLYEALEGAVMIAAEHKAAVLELAEARYGGTERFRGACERLAKAELALLEMLPERMKQ